MHLLSLQKQLFTEKGEAFWAFLLFTISITTSDNFLNFSAIRENKYPRYRTDTGASRNIV